MMKIKTLLFLLFLVVATFLFFFASKELKIDGCLDRGGSWDYSQNTCDEPN